MIAEMAIEWRKEYRGTHRAYCGRQQIAVVQGMGLVGWRYSTQPEKPWSSYYGTVVAAKKAAEQEIKRRLLTEEHEENKP